MGDLKFVEGIMPHRNGLIDVKLERRGVNGISARIALLEGLSGSFVWQGRQTRLQSGLQEIVF